VQSHSILYVLCLHHSNGNIYTHNQALFKKYSHTQIYLYVYGVCVYVHAHASNAVSTLQPQVSHLLIQTTVYQEPNGWGGRGQRRMVKGGEFKYYVFDILQEMLEMPQCTPIQHNKKKSIQSWENSSVVE
jgi:hypothetical protein